MVQYLNLLFLLQDVDEILVVIVVLIVIVFVTICLFSDNEISFSFITLNISSSLKYKIHILTIMGGVLFSFKSFSCPLIQP